MKSALTPLGIGVCLPLLASANPVISEILAANESILEDGEGGYPDWIEIHNAEGGTVDLGGYVLADAGGEWAFPEGAMVPPEGYLVVFASGRMEDGPNPGGAGHWHADFRLGRTGESLSLRSPSGEVLSLFEEIPNQRTDVSYGVASNGTVGYFETPTPGKANGGVTLGYVGDAKFSVDRGYYQEPFQVAISAEPADATILYTTDGSDPDKGTIFTGPNGQIYSQPIPISRTAVLKAMGN